MGRSNNRQHYGAPDLNLAAVWESNTPEFGEAYQDEEPWADEWQIQDLEPEPETPKPTPPKRKDPFEDLKYLTEEQAEPYDGMTIGRPIHVEEQRRALAVVEQAGLPFKALGQASLHYFDYGVLAPKLHYGRTKVPLRDQSGDYLCLSPYRTFETAIEKLRYRNVLEKSALRAVNVPVKELGVRAWPKRSLAWLVLRVGDVETEEYDISGQLTAEQIRAANLLVPNRPPDVKKKERKNTEKDIAKITYSIPLAKVDLSDVSAYARDEGISESSYIHRLVRRSQPDMSVIDLLKLRPVEVPFIPTKHDSKKH